MRIISFTLVLLLLIGCSKEEGTKAKESTSPLVATWQLEDIQVGTEIAGTKVSLDLQGIVNSISDSDEVSTATMLACFKSIRLEFKKTSFKIYTSSTNTTCELINEASGEYTADAEEIDFKKEFDFAFENLTVKKATYIINDNMLNLTTTTTYQGATAAVVLKFKKSGS